MTIALPGSACLPVGLFCNGRLAGPGQFVLSWSCASVSILLPFSPGGQGLQNRFPPVHPGRPSTVVCPDFCGVQVLLCSVQTFPGSWPSFLLPPSISACCCRSRSPLCLDSGAGGFRFFLFSSMVCLSHWDLEIGWTSLQRPPALPGVWSFAETFCLSAVSVFADACPLASLLLVEPLSYPQSYPSAPNTCIGGAGAWAKVAEVAPKGLGDFSRGARKRRIGRSGTSAPVLCLPLTVGSLAPPLVGLGPVLSGLGFWGTPLSFYIGGLLSEAGACLVDLWLRGPWLGSATPCGNRSWCCTSHVVSACLTCVDAFFRSLLVLCCAALIRALLYAVPGRSTPLGSLVRFPTSPAPLRPLLALAVGSPAHSVLHWGHVPRNKTRSRQGPGPRPFCSRRVALCLWLIGFSSLPCHVWAAPEGFHQLQRIHTMIAPLHSAPPVFGEHYPSELPVATDRQDPSSAVGICIDLPSRHSSEQPPVGSWLGVTLYSPHHPTSAFAMRVEPGSTVSRLHHVIREEGRLPCEEYDAMVAVYPQLLDGYLYLLSFPSVIAQVKRPYCAAVLDLSRVGGPCFADVIPTDLRLTELLERVSRLITVDVQEEPVHVWVGDSRQPASRQGLLNVFPGVLIAVVRADVPGNEIPPTVYPASRLLADCRLWERIDHMLSPRKALCLAVCCGLKIDPVFPGFFPRLSRADIALQVCRTDLNQATVFLVDNLPTLEIQGEPCTQTAVVVPVLEHATEAHHTGAQAYFLDVRPLGIAPRLVLLDWVNPDLPDILQKADIEFPTGLCGMLISNKVYGSLQVLRVGWAPDLAHVVCRGLVGSAEPDFSAPAVDSAPPVDLNPSPTSSPFGPGHAGNEPVRPALTDFGGDADPPDAHAVLNLAATDDDIVELIDATFVVFSPRFKHEVLRLALPHGCEVDYALAAVSEARTSDASVAFDCLLDVDPQPDLGFASVLAVPVWSTYRICLVDTRSIDGRLYAQQFADDLSRSSILLQIGVPDAPGTRLFLAGRELALTGLHPIPHGGLLVVVLPNVRPDPRFSLSQLLTGLAEWHLHSPFLEANPSTDFLMISDGGCRVLPVDLDGTTTSERFKHVAAEAFLYSVDKTTICPTLPRMVDVAQLGRDCQAVVAATEQICRIPIPPGRLRAKQHLVFLDCRLLLADMTWRLVPHGVLELSCLETDYQERVPFGHSLSVTGGRRESRGYREFIHVAHGEVLGLRFVEHLPSTGVFPDDSSSDGGQDHGTSPHDSGSDEESSESSLSGPSSVDGPRAASRSRSPKGPRPPPPADSLKPSPLFAAVADPGPDGQVLCLAATKADSGQVLDLLLSSLLHVVGVSCWDLHPLFACPFKAQCYMSNLVEHLGSPCLACSGGQSDLSALPIPFGCAPVSCKTLDEPATGGSALSNALACLRYFAPRLGPAWRYRPPVDAVHIDPDSGSGSEVSDSDTEPATLHFAVLSPGFALERVTVLLQLPATVQEAIAELQRCRPAGRAQAFPRVVPARPQPCPGNGVVLALPAWCSDASDSAVFLCMDTSQLDGRIFVAACPPYVSRRHLLRLAHLAEHGAVDVLAGEDPAPLAGFGQHHMSTGDVVLFVPAGSVVPTLYSLAGLLLSRREWSPTLVLPRASSEGRYGLIHEQEAVLFFSDFAQPTLYRAQIAACVGIRQQQLRIYPSSPRICDAVLDGWPCRTIIAVCELSQALIAPSYGILVDARAALQGWRTVMAVAGRISCIQLRTDLQRESPPGWRIRLQEVPDEIDLLPVTAGQVLVAELVFAQAPVNGAGGTQDTAGARVSYSGIPSGTGRGPSHTEAMASPGPAPTHGGESAETYTSASPSRSGAVLPLFHACSFLILGQDYTLEHVEVRLQVGTSVADALRAVSAARAPRDLEKLPLVQAVHPQPQISHALCVATPEWEPAGAIVVFDCRGIDGRLFSLQLVGRITRHGLLTAAQLDGGSDVQVYIGSQPWPLVDGPAIDLLPGELVLFATADGPHHAVASLQEMLSSAAGWEEHFDPAALGMARPASLTWVFGDAGSFFFDARPARHRQLRQDVALAVNAAPRDLMLQAATLDPPDFAHRGIGARILMAALRIADFLPSVRSGPVVCFVDARPILLGVTYQVCPDGIMVVSDLIARFVPRCPAGYVVCLLNPQSELQLPGSTVVVGAGEVLTVHFRYGGLGSDDSHFSWPPDDYDGGHGNRPSGGDSRLGGGSTQGAFASPPTSSSADTGGTGHVSGGSTGYAVQGNAVMWMPKLVRDAVPAGTWGFTSVRLCAACPGVVLAVCRRSSGPVSRSFPSSRSLRRDSADGAPEVPELFSLDHSSGDVADVSHRNLSLPWSSELPAGTGRRRRQLGAPGDASYHKLLGSLSWTVAVACLGLVMVWSFSGCIWGLHLPVTLLLGLSCRQRPLQWLVWASLLIGRSCVLVDAVQLKAASGGPTGSVSTLRSLRAGSAASHFTLPGIARPMPTPCRARLGASSVMRADPDFELDGRTLLEEAVRDPGRRAFFLASTLLDTLIEHFAGVQWDSLSHDSMAGDAVRPALPMRLCLG